MEQPVFGEVEGVDLDFGRLAGMDEPDILIRHFRFDLEVAVARHHFEQRLRGRHDAADRMHRELLHGAVDGRGQTLQLGALVCAFIRSSLQPGRLLLGGRPDR